MSSSIGSTRRVSYFYDEEVGNYHYGQGHPMRPHRVRFFPHSSLSFFFLFHFGLFHSDPFLSSSCSNIYFGYSM